MRTSWIVCSLLAPSLALAAPSAAEIKASMKIEEGKEPCDSDDGKGVQPPLPAGAKVGGRVQRTVRWTDASGEYLAAFWVKDVIKDQTECGIQSRHMQVDIFKLKANKATLYRTAREVKGKDCFEVSETKFDEPISVDDLNGNGIGELRFSYTAGCNPHFKEAKPVVRKLMVLEGKTSKAIFRGQTRVKTDKGVFGGSYKEERFKNDQVRVEAARAWTALLDDDVK